MATQRTQDEPYIPIRTLRPKLVQMDDRTLAHSCASPECPKFRQLPDGIVHDELLS